MKKILYTTLILLAAINTAHAAQPQKNIAISDVRTSITGEELYIFFHVSASGLSFGCDGMAKLEFAVENSDRRLVLPVIIYSGKTRYHYERRREELSGAYHVEPYHNYSGVKKNKTYELDYKITTPYYPWMEHASATFVEYARNCTGEYIVSEGVLVTDLNPAPVYVEPEIWKPNPAYYAQMVRFEIPEVEEVKARASMLSLQIGFPVNKTDVRPDFGNNRAELGRADSLIVALQTQNDLIDIRGVKIKGYASPEGSYTNNDRLAKGRSEGFKTYLTTKYPGNHYIRSAETSHVAEDWQGLALLVQASDLPKKDEVLAVVLDPVMKEDAKEAALKKIGQWSYVYKPMLDEMFPKLRRIELTVDYTVRNLTDNEARELLYTNPSMLSLEEIYRVARYYETGSRQYREVYEIAAKQYPDDKIANNNAAAALLLEGNAGAALPYLQKIEGTPESLINYAAYWYIMENLDKATEYLNKAKEVESEQDEATRILNLITPAR